MAGTFILLLLGDERGAQMQTTASQPDWGALVRLVGEWSADSGSGGEPGVATRGGETWTRELDGQVLVRRDFSEYAATAKRPAFRHEGLTVFSRSPSSAVRAHFNDNEGHSIDSDVASQGDSIVLTSPEADGLGLRVGLSPILFGQGEPLLAGIDLPALGYRVKERVFTEAALHLVVGR
jgi:hypothetical protein